MPFHALTPCGLFSYLHLHVENWIGWFLNLNGINFNNDREGTISHIPLVHIACVHCVRPWTWSPKSEKLSLIYSRNKNNKCTSIVKSNFSFDSEPILYGWRITNMTREKEFLQFDYISNDFIYFLSTYFGYIEGRKKAQILQMAGGYDSWIVETTYWKIM